MAEEIIEAVAEEVIEDGGKVVFANDVVATIASIAASEVEGIAGMNGGVVECITERLGKKNLTKGVKIEMNGNEVSADVSVNVKYGYAIHTVCKNLQEAVKNGIEMMTGLSVTCVNVLVQNVVIEKEEKKEEKEVKETKPAVEVEEAPAEVLPEEEE